jgi:hypothetical protein
MPLAAFFAPSAVDEVNINRARECASTRSGLVFHQKYKTPAGEPASAAFLKQ